MPIIDQHLAHLALANRTRATIDHRRRVLNLYQRSLDGRPLTAGTRQDVIAFVGQPHLAPESRRCYRAHLRGFYLWALDEQLIPVDPTDRVPGIRIPRTVPRPIPTEALALALACASARMRVWMLLMCGAGLRCLEVAALEPRDVILDPYPFLHLRVVKGGGQATVPLHPVVLESLLGLPVRNGLWWTSSANTVSRDVGLYLRSLGINASAHSLRHRAVTDWYESSGQDVITTQRLARHRSLGTVMRYADVSPTRPAEVVAATRLAG